MALALLLVALSPPYRPGHAQRQAPIERDSAGILIVELPSTPFPSLGQLSERPSLVLGVSSGDPAYEFGGLSGAVRLRDGTLVVADALSAAVRFFDSEGRPIATAGGRGSGPGEFQSLSWIKRVDGHRVIAYDRVRRTTILDARGEVVATEQSWGPPVGVFESGDVLFSRVNRLGVERTPGSVGRLPSWYLVARAGSKWLDVDTVAMLPGSDPQLSSVLRGTGGVMAAVTRARPFGRTASAVVVGKHFVYAEGTDWELRFYTAAGRLARVVRRDVNLVPVTDQDLREWVREYAATLPEPRRARVAEMYRDFTPPPHMPPIGRVLVDPERHIWVEAYRRPGSSVQTWHVLSEDGMPVGQLVIPAGLHVVDVALDHLVVLVTADDDTDRVQLFEVGRPE